MFFGLLELEELNFTSLFILFLQLSAFSQLSFADGQNMTGTYRPVQPLNGREVYHSGSVAVWVNTVVLLSSVLATVGLSFPE